MSSSLLSFPASNLVTVVNVNIEDGIMPVCVWEVKGVSVRIGLSLSTAICVCVCVCAGARIVILTLMHVGLSHQSSL